jgi:type IV secretory pathway VirB10-like protein
MNEEDKAAARKALESKRLTIEQVQEIRAEVDRTGRAFVDVAVERGLLKREAPPSPPPPPPPAAPARKPAEAPVAAAPRKPIPTLYVILLGCTLLIMLGVPVSLLRLVEHTRKDEDLAVETERSRVEAERQAGDASRGYKRAVVSGNEAVAREQLAKARAAMTLAEKSTDPAERTKALNEAFVGYNMYLLEIPDDVEVRIERAGTHQARRNYDLAVADLERAIELRRDLEPTLRDRITQLRLFIARKPQ